MITLFEKEKMERIFAENRLKNKKPMNTCQLAPILGVTRQALYACLNGKVKSSPTLNKLQEWISSRSNISYKDILRVYEHKVDLLANYGFTKVDDDTWQTEKYEKNGIVCRLIVDRNLVLSIHCISKNNYNELIDEILITIFQLSKNRIVKIDGEVE